MIKLYVSIIGGYDDDSREYEISNELAEFLRIKSWGDYVDEMEEEDKTCSEIEMNISNEEVEDILDDTNTPKSIADELLSIDDDASDAAYELAIGSFIDENPPTEWDFSEWKRQDLEAGLFKPSRSFEQFLKEEEMDPSDEDYDEEEAKDEYLYSLEDEYQVWVDELPPSKRSERYGLDEFMAIDYVRYGYEFTLIDKEAKN